MENHKQKIISLKLILFLLAVAFLSFIILTGFRQKDILPSQGQIEKTVTVSIGHKQIKAFVADTPELQEKGLGDRASITSDEAMLFIFQVPAPYGFWMKDMNFPIDMFWLDQSGRIIFIEANVLPSSYPEVFTPPSPAQYVLETQAGFAAENDLKIGDEVSFSKED